MHLSSQFWQLKIFLRDLNVLHQCKYKYRFYIDFLFPKIFTLVFWIVL
ncbi:hypothetical protein Nmel_002525 [Mimus melanotis]